MARRHQLSAPDTDELTSVVRYKLIDKDFAILKKFQGRSSMATYLTVVVERLCLDFFNERWGKWRPSSAALKHGAVAVHLEQLVVRAHRTATPSSMVRSLRNPERIRVFTVPSGAPVRRANS